MSDTRTLTLTHIRVHTHTPGASYGIVSKDQGKLFSREVEMALE